MPHRFGASFLSCRLHHPCLLLSRFNVGICMGKKVCLNDVMSLGIVVYSSFLIFFSYFCKIYYYATMKNFFRVILLLINNLSPNL